MISKKKIVLITGAESGIGKSTSKLFLNNNHRVTFTLFPDIKLDEKKEKAEEKFLSEKLRTFTEKDKNSIRYNQ